MERKAVHVDSIRLLIVNLNAIKRTELLTEYNNNYCISCMVKAKKENKNIQQRPFSFVNNGLENCRRANHIGIQLHAS